MNEPTYEQMMDLYLNGAIDHLCNIFLGAGGEVGRGESESTVCPCIIRLEVKGHFLLPLVAITEVYAVHAYKPVGAGNHLHHQGQLSIRERMQFEAM